MRATTLAEAVIFSFYTERIRDFNQIPDAVTQTVHVIMSQKIPYTSLSITNSLIAPPMEFMHTKLLKAEFYKWC